MDREALLLEEYKLCQQWAASIETHIWQTFAIFAAGTVTSFAIIASGDMPWGMVLLVATLASLLLMVWWLASLRWWSMQHLRFTRMRHIEEVLGLLQIRYVSYKDADLRGDLTAADLGSYRLAGDHFLELKGDVAGAKAFARGGVQKWFRTILYFAPAGWIALVLSRAHRLDVDGKGPTGRALAGCLERMAQHLSPGSGRRGIFEGLARFFDGKSELVIAIMSCILVLYFVAGIMGVIYYHLPPSMAPLIERIEKRYSTIP